MTYAYSRASRDQLSTCDHRLQLVFTKVLERVDHTIIEGHRGRKLQEEYFRIGTSQLDWPSSKHNSLPSLGVDAAPYPIDWNNIQRFAIFSGYVLGVADSLGIRLCAGIDWDGNFDPTDNWVDAAHFEIVVE